MNDQNLDLCHDVMKGLDHKQLREIINDLVLPYFDKSELIDMIEDRFMDCDWQWFFEEYIQDV